MYLLQSVDTTDVINRINTVLARVKWSEHEIFWTVYILYSRIRFLSSRIAFTYDTCDKSDRKKINNFLIIQP